MPNPKPGVLHSAFASRDGRLNSHTDYLTRTEEFVDVNDGNDVEVTTAFWNPAERVIVVQGNMLVPMPGSFVFSSLAHRARERGLDDPLRLEVQGRIGLWLQEFAQVGFDECAAAQNSIEAISPRRHSYSMPRP